MKIRVQIILSVAFCTLWNIATEMSRSLFERIKCENKVYLFTHNSFVDRGDNFDPDIVLITEAEREQCQAQKLKNQGESHQCLYGDEPF